MKRMIMTILWTKISNCV